MTYARLMVAMVAVVLGAAACGDNSKQKPDAGFELPDAGRSAVTRGRYIMNTLGACTFCHTPLNPDGSRDTTRLFAGVDCLVDIDPATAGFGCVSSRNLTNDVTGLKNKTDQEIKNAFTMGTRTDGKILAPIMPYYIFHNMTESDKDAVVAYLRTVPAISHTVMPNEQPWAGINDGVVATCNMLGTQGTTACKADFIDPATLPMPVAGYANQAAALRGRYLAGQVGLCVDCHTPELPHVPVNNPIPPLFPRPLDVSKFYTGGRVFLRDQLGLVDPSYPMFINTRNLTPDATGLMGYTLTDIKNAVALGKDRQGKAVCAGTHGSLISPYAALDQSDQDDIANYVASLAPVVHDTSPDCQGPPVP